MLRQITRNMMNQWQFQPIYLRSVKNCRFPVSFLHSNLNLALASMFCLFSMAWQARPWGERTSVSKSLTMKRPMMFKRKELMKKKRRNNKIWLTIFKSIKKINWMKENRLEPLLLTKTNRLFTLLLMRMIGNSNAKEWQINWKFKIKAIINNGDRESNQLEQRLIL